MKPDITFERFIEILVPGAILTVGTWYFHRPFLMVFFPAVASDNAILGATGATLGAKASLFLFAAVCVGVLVHCMSDIAVVCAIHDASHSEKAMRLSRKALRFLAWPFVIFRARDPRVHAMRRYLRSPRSEAFIRMAKGWAVSDGSALADEDGLILAHQHIITRLKITSDTIRTVLTEIYQPVRISSAVFLAFALLVPVGLLSFASASIVQDRVAVHPRPILLALTLGVYGFALVAGYSLQRHFRHFCSQAMTLALHRFMKEEVAGPSNPST